MIRSAAAVIIGYIIFAASAVLLFQFTGIAPHAPATKPFMALSTVYGMAFAVVGAWVATKLSASHSRKHGFALAILIALGAVGSLIASPATDAKWSQVTALLLMAPAAAAAGIFFGTPRGAEGSLS